MNQQTYKTPYRNIKKHLMYLFPIWQGSFYKRAIKLCCSDVRLGVVHMNIMTAGLALYVSGYRKNNIIRVADLIKFFPFGNINFAHYANDLIKAGLLVRVKAGRYIITAKGIQLIKRFNSVLLELQSDYLNTFGVDYKGRLKNLY